MVQAIGGACDGKQPWEVYAMAEPMDGWEGFPDYVAVCVTLNQSINRPLTQNERTNKQTNRQAIRQ